MKSQMIYRKVCRTAEQAAKERAVLRVLQDSSLRGITPRPAEGSKDPLTVEMSAIDGRTLVPDDLDDRRRLGQIGTALRQVHELRPCGSFGPFDADLNVSRCFATFSEFLEAQIAKWAEWHAPALGSYLSCYVKWVRDEFQALRGYFDLVEPVFCHGDFDAKNLIVRDGHLVGLVDWEHAGTYCLAWELRKLDRLLVHDRQWEVLLAAYGLPKDVDRSELRLAIRCLNAADLLGHLRWCLRRGLVCEAERTMHLMHAFLAPKEVG